ncbi:hypothetical protein HTZ77_26990 [Nonomuraea sp. SMC257]|uniref:Uncharacterized protein n=1 Tax=Nonomuraea montanisoli TaxID=2741721 RepID=A0A7Y6IC59_9ACTN|nr:hypothetical protein [Nonomuraea montanisoli]NUW35048.1 hypothetical protein [Nonomuraea montanisoli]
MTGPAQVALTGSYAGRQLAVLRSTYPGWEIQRVIITANEAEFTAKLRRPITAAMAAAGVEAQITEPDAASLASALSQQAALIHNCRAFYTRPD